MSQPAPAVVVSDLGFSWPDGTAVLADLSTAIGTGRSGLVGVNGCGKSTLLRLIAGELTPATGDVTAHGRLGYVPQDVTLGRGVSVAAVLGVDTTLAALRAIEAGDAAERHFAAAGDDWDVEERARAVLDRLGLTAVDLDRCTLQLSGGEAVLLQLAAVLLRAPDVLLLDEPTNNLDGPARERLYEAVDGWAGTLVVVTTTESCSVSSTGSEICATAPSGGTAVRGTTTAPRWRPSRRPRNGRSARPRTTSVARNGNWLPRG